MQCNSLFKKRSGSKFNVFGSTTLLGTVSASEPESCVDGLVDPLGVEHQADGQQHEHLVRLLVDLVVLVGLCLGEGKT